MIFISILASKLPAHQQDRARKVGLLAAGGMRIVLLLFIGLILQLKTELFSIGSLGFSGKDLILLAGGLFLIAKATNEIHHKLEGEADHQSGRAAPTFAAVIAQILLLDLVFSVDSVLTAVGMTTYVPVMVIAVLFSVVVMLGASRPIYRFVNKHPSVKILALAYAAMTFSVLVEMLNIGARKNNKPQEPVHLYERVTADDSAGRDPAASASNR